MKLCKNGHIIGSNPECRCCQRSIAIKLRWVNPTEAMKAAAVDQTRKRAGFQSKSEATKEKLRAYFSSELHKQRARENGKKTSQAQAAGLIARSNKYSDTKPELAVENALIILGVKYTKQYKLGPYDFDFYLDELKTLVEVQGTYWHSLPNNISRDIAKETFIIKNHSGLKLRYISDIQTASVDLINIIKRVLGIEVAAQVLLNFGDLIVEPISASEAVEFMACYHYLPRFRKGTLGTIGVKHNGSLVGIAIFGTPTYSNAAMRHGTSMKEVAELCRFVLRPDYNVKNMASWFLSRATKMFANQRSQIKLIISFADSYFGHSGTIYKACNWTIDGLTRSSYYYENPSGDKIHKKTLWDMAIKLGQKEDEFALANGFRRIDTTPKQRFIYWLKPRQLTEPSQDNILKETMAIKCLDCSNDFAINQDSLNRSNKKYGGYVCHPCSIRRAAKLPHAAILYPEGSALCLDCDKPFEVSKKAFASAFRKHGGYLCMGCAVKRSIIGSPRNTSAIRIVS